MYPLLTLNWYRKHTDVKTTNEEARKVLEFYEKEYDDKKRFLELQKILTEEGFIVQENETYINGVID